MNLAGLFFFFVNFELIEKSCLGSFCRINKSIWDDTFELFNDNTFVLFKTMRRLE